jgi:hypothetical protein
MKNIVTGEKGQAMTEFVMAIPVFVVILVAMYQFTLIGIRRVELAMFEREAMRYLTYDGEDAQKINDFKDEYAQRSGLAPENLRISLTEGKAAAGLDSGKSGLNFFNKITGAVFTVEYDEPLIPAAAKVMNREHIMLRSRLFTATGGSFKFNIKEEAKKIFGNMGGKTDNTASDMGEDN